MKHSSFLEKLNHSAWVMVPLGAIPAILLFGLFLTGCSDTSNLGISSQAHSEQVQEYDLQEFPSDSIPHFFYYTDSETGVQYVVFRQKYMNAGFGGITPRLKPDGSLYIQEGEVCGYE